MKLATQIWSRAILIYVLINLPTLAMPIMFFFSVGLALVCGLPALVIFLPVPGLLRKAGITQPFSALVLIGGAAMLLCFEATYLACFIMKEDHQTIRQAMQEWLVFPGIAWAATFISVATHFRSVKQYCNTPLLQHHEDNH